MIGGRLDAYEVLSELGSGGMGTVYLGRCIEAAAGLAQGTKVALKVVHPHLLTQPGYLPRFLREARIGLAVRHENVVRCFDCKASEVDGRPAHFLVMEYVEGQTLRDLLVELERVPEELCRHIGREVAGGLAAIHKAGVVHRDLKPENVLITPEHVVKVMDLGVARLQDEALRLSQTGAFVGSLPYAAPEQFRHSGGELDGRADLHALGVVLYELATGVHPYRDADVPTTLRNILDVAPRRAGEVNPQLSPFFEEVVHCLLAKDREERFESGTALVEVFDEAEDGPWWAERARALQHASRRPVRRVRIPRETAVYGRERELAALQGCFERAKTGAGNVLLVEGEAGIGKSRLVDEAMARLQQSGVDLTFLVGGYPPGGAATAEGGFSAAFREQFGGAGSARYLPENQVLVPAFDALLRGEGPPAGAQALNKASLQTCFVRATQSLAAERVTVVLIEDLHFAPEEGRALFTALALAVPGHRVLLVGTTRPGLPEAWTAEFARLEHAGRLDVPRLGAADLARLLNDAFGSEDLALELGAKIADKSDGNPFFVFEIIRGLREGRFIAQEGDGTWIATGTIERIEIPSSVRGLVAARVAGLHEEERELLDVAACLGFRFDAGLVGELLGMGRIPTLRHFARIERVHRLVRSVGRSHQFDHHQVQEALYELLGEQLKEELHAALAEAMEARAGAGGRDGGTPDGALAVDLSEHFLKGARGTRALRYLPRADAHLVQSYRHEAAAALTERALAVPGLLAGVDRVQALLRLAAALEPIGARARHEEAVREAVDLASAAGDPTWHARALHALGFLLRLLARHEEARAVLEEAAKVATACGDTGTLAAATSTLGLVFFEEGRFEEARGLLERYRTLEREVGDRRGEAVATANLSLVLWRQGRLPEARTELERSLELSRTAGDLRGQAVAHGNLGSVAYLQGRLPDARTHWERFLALGREVGDRVHEATATGNLGNWSRAQGRLSEARDRYLRHLQLSTSLGYRSGEAIALVNLGAVWLALADLERARETLERAVSLCREIHAPYPLGYGLLDLGRVADARGDATEARRAMEESLALRRSIGHGDGVADTLIELADLERRQGCTEAARAAAREALTLSREQGRAPEIARALALAACLPEGDVAAAETALDACESESTLHARYLLWLATGDHEHLAEAKRLLDAILERVPEHRAAMRTNVRLNREIMDAWNAHGGE